MRISLKSLDFRRNKIRSEDRDLTEADLSDRYNKASSPNELPLVKVLVTWLLI